MRKHLQGKCVTMIIEPNDGNVYMSDVSTPLVTNSCDVMTLYLVDYELLIIYSCVNDKPVRFYLSILLFC